MTENLQGLNRVVRCVSCLCAVGAPLMAQTPERIVRGAAVEQANVEYGLLRGSKPRTFGQGDFAIQLVRAQDSVRLYRAVVQFSENRHPYTVMIVGARVYGLGGFTAPELIQAARAWSAVSPPAAPAERAVELARMADWNGAQDFVGPSSSAADGQSALVRQRWSELADPTWPPDAALVGPGGSAIVTLTVFSRAVQDFIDGWDPILYRMAFAESGELVAWASKRGPRFSVQ
jgi:hypothetical protein